jgi:preprotein translocase subunit SecE
MKIQRTSSTLGLNRYVHFVFIVGGFLVAYLLIRIIESIWVYIAPPNEFLIRVIGIGMGIAGALYCWRHYKIRQLAIETVNELAKVTWPTRKETSASTVVVIITVIIAAFFLGFFDFFWAWITDFIYIN